VVIGKPLVIVGRVVPEEAPELKALMVASKQYWDYSDEWIAAWVGRLVLTAQYLPDHADEVYVAVVQTTLAGFYALLSQGPLCILEDLWVRPDHIRTGVGRRSLGTR